jgi:hypothetical protein
VVAENQSTYAAAVIKVSTKQKRRRKSAAFQ